MGPPCFSDGLPEAKAVRVKYVLTDTSLEHDMQAATGQMIKENVLLSFECFS